MEFNSEEAYQALSAQLGGRVRRNEPLSRHGTFGVGGPADLWVSLDTQEAAIGLITMCAECHWPLLITGNGTNVLYSDAGVRGIVARMAMNSYTIEDHGDGTALLVADAGLSWPRITNDLVPLGWGGLEFGPGIPGTLGGGVISNAGVHGHEIGDVLEWVDVLDTRDTAISPKIIRYHHADLDIGFRHSRFRAQRRVQFDERGYPIVAPRGLIEPSEIIIQLACRLTRANPAQLRATVDEHKQYRKRTQPTAQSAGSVFKNPPGDYSGRLIEAVGLKGRTHGGAQISERHANFIINAGGATAADIVALIREAHSRVYEQFGIDLEMEVEPR